MNIYNMKLHDKIIDNDIEIVRVPGGWLYDKTFVKYCSEFAKKININTKPACDIFYNKQVENNKDSKHINLYKSFISYLYQDNPLKQRISHVLNLENQLSYNEFVSLLDKSGDKDKLKELFDSLINNKSYTKDRKSIYLIINTWLSRDYNKKH